MADRGVDPTFFSRSQPIVIASQDSAAGLLPTQVAPTITFATSGASSSDARRADSTEALRPHSLALALVPRHTSTFASPRAAPYMARSPPLRPRFSAAPPSMADVFFPQFIAWKLLFIFLSTINATCCGACNPSGSALKSCKRNSAALTDALHEASTSWKTACATPTNALQKCKQTSAPTTRQPQVYCNQSRKRPPMSDSSACIWATHFKQSARVLLTSMIPGPPRTLCSLLIIELFPYMSQAVTWQAPQAGQAFSFMDSVAAAASLDPQALRSNFISA